MTWFQQSLAKMSKAVKVKNMLWPMKKENRRPPWPPVLSVVLAQYRPYLSMMPALAFSRKPGLVPSSLMGEVVR